MITIIDYGLGNIQAFVNVYKRLHVPVRVATCSDDFVGTTKLILPGVGAFDHAMQRLDNSGMRDSVDGLVLVEKMPVLGICVGMQMLANGSDEGSLPGLGWVPGQVRAFASSPASKDLALPHMGWNDVTPETGAGLFAGLEKDSKFYFLHSFYFECLQQEHKIAAASYGLDFTCAVAAGNVHGVQFHPEKSHHFGVTLLKNFAEL